MVEKLELIKYFDYLVDWIKQETQKAQKKGVIFGLSGGVDSALVATLAQKAFPENHLAVIMPIIDMQKNLNDIDLLIKKFAIKNKKIALDSTFNSLKSELNLGNKLAVSNIQPRLRMTTLYALAQELDYLVLGTDNYSEMFLGYFTKYGDGGADLLPIVNLTKMQVFAMAKAIGIPDEIIRKKPSANLWEDQSDEDELGFGYQDLEFYFENPNQVDKKIVQKIVNLHTLSNHKRLPIPKPEKKLGDF
ncbi:NAD(+) synthase [Mycoplasma sp. 'Moose RK']|uniref:NAD(+) synthase n=1 Tax=Mycoplasma sp. 'Moose RK' TaxID=2780095 RepID=UPI0018C2C944|nr:NAD(+) synthase [Mycoplasma sp. 'Moose RK']MBG0730886.1 NAD(+) synthase [Mycoplasma sp. 'Moose RK']